MLTLINTNHETLIVRRGETETAWNYDVVEVKLTIEAIEKKHGLRTGDKVQPYTLDFLEDCVAGLAELGLPNLTLGNAFRIVQLVNTQFVKLAAQVQSEVEAIAKAK